MHNGERLDAATMAGRLLGRQVLDRARAAGLVQSAPDVSERDQMQGVLEGWLCTEWAIMLLGRGFGNGEHSMYGGFTADLEAGTIADDPDAVRVDPPRFQ